MKILTPIFLDVFTFFFIGPLVCNPSPIIAAMSPLHRGPLYPAQALKPHARLPHTGAPFSPSLGSETPLRSTFPLDCPPYPAGLNSSTSRPPFPTGALTLRAGGALQDGLHGWCPPWSVHLMTSWRSFSERQREANWHIFKRCLKTWKLFRRQ